jgi:hypothetical protein
MTYLDLPLKNLDEISEEACFLNDVLKEKNLVVVLGPPGSGKSSILTKYYKENSSNSTFTTVRQFLRSTFKLANHINVLLLDGLDEYRSASNVDKISVMMDLADKIRTLEIDKTVLSCRELDWYGEVDITSLRDIVGEHAYTYQILPLSEELQIKFAQLYQIENEKSFIEKFTSYGFLDNPQLFRMTIKIYKHSPDIEFQSKKDLFGKFFSILKEENNFYKIHKATEIETSLILKMFGYLAAFYFFSSIDTFDEEVLDTICDKENGFSKSELEIVLKTPLFSERAFIHRMLAEYALAYYYAMHFLSDGFALSLRKVANRFTSEGRIPTELRGTFAWLCSLSGSMELIGLDPYYQAIYGDNSLLSNQQKIEVVLQVKEYAKSNPYFFERHHQMDLSGFYNNDHDSFLIGELSEALTIDNHYHFFLVNLITASSIISLELKNKLKEYIDDASIQAYKKRKMLGAFNSDTEYLKEILQKVKTGLILDSSDDLKEEILRTLYPKHIDVTEIVPYLFEYQSQVTGYCYYLYDTDYIEKYTLIDDIFKLSSASKRQAKLTVPYNVRSFVADYFLETCLLFDDPDNPLSAQEIYSIIKHFKQYYDSYEPLEIKSYRYVLKNKLKQSGEKLIKLADKLFSYFIDDLISENSELHPVLDFNNFYDLKPPAHPVQIILSKMSSSLSKKINELLFFHALNYSTKDTLKSENFRKAAEKLGFVEQLEARINPPKRDWEIERENREKKEKEERQSIIEENEKYFSRPDSEIKCSFNDLNFIAQMLFIDDDSADAAITEDTKNRLTKILKDSISSPLSLELLSTKSLADLAPTANRNIDIVYYVSCTLNHDFEFETIEVDYLKYLYLNCVFHERSMNVRKGNFSVRLETKSPLIAKSAIREFIAILLERFWPDQKEIVTSYIEKIDTLKQLKSLTHLYGSDEELPDKLLENIIKVLNFKITEEHLKTLALAKTTSQNLETISALLLLIHADNDQFSINHAISLFVLFKHNIEAFKELSGKQKVDLLNLMYNQFNTDESVANVSGFQSEKAQCASFLRNNSLNLIAGDELKGLKQARSSIVDIWTYQIDHRLSQLAQTRADSEFSKQSLTQLKKFLLEGVILSKNDFFDEVCQRLDELRIRIEDNRDNDKDPFFNTDKTSKNETACRDEVLRSLKKQYSSYMELVPEKPESNNLVDINIKYRENPDFEVQIECKKDSNRGIYKGIQDQLIGKYFSSTVQFGVYLVFYFGDKKDKEQFLDKINSTIPQTYQGKIRVICFDLTKG